MILRSPTLCLLAAVALLAGARTAAPAAAQPAQPAQKAGDIPFETYKLENGLNVILAPDRTAPVVAVDVWYDVGSRNERPGRTGFAHLFEHMMFQGSQNVGKSEHMQLIERAGGSMNGSTNEDRTNYFESLPSNRLNLGLWLEADRMRSLAVNEENLTNQREVVKEERRLRVDNQPYTSSILAALYEVPYNKDTCFGYAHTVIGSMDDLNAASLSDVKQFFDTYYRPNNATLTVVGDFDPAEAKSLIQQYFGSIPAGSTPPPFECASPFSTLPQRRVINDPNANLPAVSVVYGIPATNNPDVFALVLLNSLMMDGESSRIYQRLVKQEKAALQASSFFSPRRGPGLFGAFAIANQGVTADRLEALLEEEFQKVIEGGVSAEELAKAKNRVRAFTVRSRQTMMGKAEDLQQYAHFYGDPSAIRGDLERYEAVTREDIRRVATQYLNPNNRAVVVTQPGAAAKE
jgi:predicted Zn-dependent peptidase